VNPIRYLLDENVDPILRAQLIRHAPELVVWKTGDPGAPKRGTPDPDILLWCGANDFVLVTGNRRSMPVHLQAHLAAGYHVSGILMLHPDMTIGATLDQLLLIWEASEAEEYRDLLLYLPL
jgi:hypothetical protein